MNRICFVELPADDTHTLKAFYGAAFAMQMTDFAPTYACTLTGAVDLGIQADPAERTASVLVVIEVADLAAAERAVVAAGGRITLPAFSFPGGRRFHFRDPAGHELAAMQREDG